MLPSIFIGSFELPLYGLISLVGFACAIALACHLSPISGIPKIDVLFASFYGIIGLAIFAKLFYFIGYLPIIIEHFDLFKQNLWSILLYGFSGFVFYGGLIGLMIGLIVYCKQFHIRMTPLMNIIAPAIPLFHGFGRIACFMGGCCYGIEYHGPFSVQFPANEDIKTLADVPRFPTQLVESGFNFILALILFIYVKKGAKPGKALGIYLIAYPIERFLLEFLRGDAVRGHFLIFSTSQWISLILLPIGIYITYKASSKKETTN